MLEEETERKETTLDVIKRMRRESAEVRRHQRDKRQERLAVKREHALAATAERGGAAPASRSAALGGADGAAADDDEAARYDEWFRGLARETQNSERAEPQSYRAPGPHPGASRGDAARRSADAREDLSLIHI